MFMGVAYAAWKDELVVTGSVETGNLEMEVVSAVLWVQPTPPKEVLGGRISHDEKSITVEMTNLYPGHPEFRIDFELENRGSIPVRFDTATIDFSPANSPLIDELEVLLEVSYFPAGSNLGVWLINETAWFPLAELPGRLESLQAQVLETGGSLKFGGIDREADPECIKIRLRDDAGTETQGETVTFTLDLIFKQWNK